VTPVKNNLVVLGSAAVLAVYAAGYQRTRAAAEKFATESADRRRPSATATPVAPPEAAPAAREESPAVDTTTAVAPAKKHTAVSSKITGTTPRHSDSKPTPSAGAASPTDSIASHVVTPPTPAPATPPSPDSSATPVVAQATDSAAQNADKSRAYKDGTYSGWGTSRHGDIEATVLIKDGRIAAAIISQCLTRYSCSWISALPGQVAARQSPEVDFVSGATESTNAFYYAVVEALKKAK
jgi:uncharacterized protein with FMN-binding domain